MSNPRIFVSYACTGDEPGARIGKQLVNDIRANQTEAVSDHETISDERFMEFLNRELPQCGYLIVIHTPVTWQSLRVQTTVNMAHNLVTQQRMRGILRVLATPLQSTASQSLWDTLNTFDASKDYARARDKVFIELGLISLDADDSFYISRPYALSQPLPPTGNMPPQQISGPMPKPATIWPSQHSGPAAAPGPAAATNWPPQHSGPVAAPGPAAATNWPSQHSGPVAAPGPAAATNWPPQPSGPVATPGTAATTNWPPQPAAPLSNPAGPFAGTNAELRTSGKAPSAFKNSWKKTFAWFGLRRNTVQTSLTAQPPSNALILGEDRPAPLDTSQQTLLRWVIAAGLGLILVLAIILLVATHRV